MDASSLGNAPSGSGGSGGGAGFSASSKVASSEANEYGGSSVGNSVSINDGGAFWMSVSGNTPNQASSIPSWVWPAAGIAGFLLLALIVRR